MDSVHDTRSPISALRSQRCVIFGPTALPLSRGTHTEILRTRYFTLVVTRPLSYLVEEQICRLRRPHGANPRLAPSHHLFLRWQLGEETRQSSHKPTPTLFTSQGKRNHKRASVNLSVCWGHSFIVLWHLLAIAKERHTRTTSKLFTQRVSRLSPLSLPCLPS